MAKKISELNPVERAAVSTLLKMEDKSFVYENGQLLSAYQEASRNITQKIESFYGKYATENKVSYEAALEILGNRERKDYQELLKQYYKEANGNNAWQAELKALSRKVEITRLEALNNEILQEVNRLSARVEAGIKELDKTVYKDSYYRTIYNEQRTTGLGREFAKLDSKKINKAVNTVYNADDFSTSIWADRDRVVRVLRQELPQHFITGGRVQELAAILRDELDTRYNNAVRLARTETNRLNNQAVLDAYAEVGDDKIEIEILATLDNRTCEQCAAMDGMRIPLSEAKVGENIPPFHPNDRCTTVRVFSETAFDRVAKDENGKYDVIKNMTYNEWLEEYV